MTYASEQTLEPIKYVLQEVSSQEYAFAAIEIREQIQNEEHKTQEIQQKQIDLASKLQQQEQTQITSKLQQQEQIQITSDLQSHQQLQVASELQQQE